MEMPVQVCSQSASSRIGCVDFAKGIAILLVIFGHTVTISIIRAVIFSFHMPLFFILSAFTTTLSSDDAQFLRKTEKSFKRLIIPALIIYFIRIFIYVVHYFTSIKWKLFIVEKINTFVYGSGVDASVAGGVIPAFGMMWFLLVLFIGRTLFDYIHLKLSETGFILCALISSVLGVILGRIQWLPFSFDVTLSIMPFFICGFYLRKMYDKMADLFAWYFFFVSFLIWAVSFCISFFVFENYMELADRRYPLFPLCFITAISGTFVVLSVSHFLSKGKIITALMTYFGKNSLWLFFVHSIDYIWSFAYNITPNTVLSGLIRCFIDCVICFCIIKMKSYVFLKLQSDSEAHKV